MSQPVVVTLDELVAGSRVVALREAVVAALAQRFPEVEVKSHPGKLDMADVLAQGVFTAPSIHVAVARLKNEDRSSGAQDLPVYFRAYVVAENRMVGAGDEQRLIHGDEIGYALTLGLLDALGLQDVARWGLDNIDYPEAAEGEPLFTLKTFDKGAVFYVVTWRQTLLREGVELRNLGGPWTAPGGWGRS